MNACLALHGLGGGPYELRPLVDALKTRGIPTSCPVLPGHEGPGPHMGEARWEDWLAFAESAFDDLAAKEGSVAVVGFSTGATLALMLATRRPVRRLVLIAPFLAIRYLGRLPIPSDQYLRWFAKVVPRVPRRGPAAIDPEVRQSVRSTDRFETFCMRATVSALDLIEKVKPLVAAVKAPTLIMQGRHDTVVEPAGAKWLYDQIGATTKELLWFDHSDHLVVLDRDREAVLAAALDWVLTDP